MKRQFVAGAAGGSIGLSALAAAVGLCCVAPWAVALLGVSGAVALAGLAAYRFWFILAAIVLFAAGILIAWRHRDSTSATACKPRSRWFVVLFAVNALLLLIAIFAGVIQMVIQRSLMY